MVSSSSSSSEGDGGVMGRLSPFSRGVFCGVTVPAVVLLMIMVRQFGGDDSVSSRDGGAPLQVVHRPEPIHRSSPRPVYNRTMTFDKKNPYMRGKPTPVENKPPKKVATPWEMREIKDAKKTQKKATKTPPPTSTDGKPPPVVKVFPNRSSIVKPKKVFESSTEGKGYIPGEEVLPKKGEKVTSMDFFEKVLERKCASIFAFYNSEDVEMSREFSQIWNALAEREVPKYKFFMVDVASKHGMEVALNVSVVKDDASDKSSKRPSVSVEGAIGLPTVLFYPAKNSSDLYKVILKDLPPPPKKKVDAAKLIQDSVTAVSEKLAKLADELKMPLSKEGCFVKFESRGEYDAAVSLKKETRAAIKAGKNATKAAKTTPAAFAAAAAEAKAEAAATSTKEKQPKAPF